MPQLDVSVFFSQLFWLFITFGLVLLVLKKIYLPTFSRIFGERESRISGSIRNAEQAKLEAERIQEQYQQSLGHARKTASIILSEMAVELKRRAKKNQESLEKDLAKMLSESEQRIAAVKMDTKAELEKVALDTAKLAIFKFAGLDVDEQTIKTKIEQLKGRGVGN
jgi:F-type H+-transporting ATPase subunit b